MVKLLIYSLNLFFNKDMMFVKQRNLLFALDSSNKKLEYIIHELKDKDSLVIIYFQSGCFKENKKRSIIIFEKRIATNSKSGGCTLSRHYLFFLNGKIIKNEQDNTCSWDGFNELLGKLNLLPPD